MFIYGKTAANGIAVISYLVAERGRRVGSGEIAKARGISQALTAKLLTQLAAAGFVAGQPGPGGGYTLAKSPDEVSLAQIIRLFENMDRPTLCPFGPGWCGVGEPCPLHDTISKILEIHEHFVEETHLSVFLTECGCGSEKSVKQRISKKMPSSASPARRGKGRGKPSLRSGGS